MKLKKIMAVALSCVMALSLCCISAFAADQTINSSGGVANGQVQVTASVASTYTLTVPASVEMTSSGTGTGTYTAVIGVKVSEDIGANQKVTVAPTAPTLTLSGGTATKDSAFSAIIDKDWDRTETTNGDSHDFTLTADLTPGTWTGTATFACSLA